VIDDLANDDNLDIPRMDFDFSKSSFILNKPSNLTVNEMKIVTELKFSPDK
jgi:hypothetical protein